MTTVGLILKEIHLRKLNFVLGLFSLLVAVAVLTAQLTLLRAHDIRTQQILDAKQERTRQEMAQNEDAYRQIMKKLGFNLLILPAGQKLEDFYADGYAAKDMPEEYVTKLAHSGLATIRHLLPALEQKVRWPEQGQRNIILIGTRGEVPQGKAVAASELMMHPVEPGTAVLGFEVADSLKLKTGDKMTLMGQSFTVSRCNAERGTKDDVTIWINLDQAQQMLNKPGRVNSILALQCVCKGSELWNIRKDVAAILPGTQVFETEEKIITREEARKQAAAIAQKELQAEKEHRAEMRQAREALASWLIPLITLGAALWIALLILSNVRERRGEIGILRAIGFSASRILFIFLGKSILLGILGAVLGYGIGYAVGVLSGETGWSMQAAKLLFEPRVMLMALIAAPILAALAALPPALWASRLDPALALRED